MSANASKLRLYVVGEHSADPADWHPWGGYALVLATSPEEAVGLVGDLHGPPAIEVSTDKPALLCSVPLVTLH
jgi:hypothetical protein